MKIGDFNFKATLVLIAYLIFASAPALAKQTVTIGIMLKFGEEYDGTITHMMKGIETATSVGKDKFPNIDVKLVKYSHTDDFATVIASCNRAIADKVDVVIGGEDSNQAIVMSELLGKAKIPFLTPTATNPKVTSLSDRTYAFSMSDAQVSKLLAEFLAKRLNVKKVGVMRGVSSPYTDYLSQQFAENLSKIGGVEVFEHRYVRGEVNFKPAIEEWKKLGIQHVAMLSYESSFVHLWNQSHELDYRPVYLGADGWGSANIIREKLYKGNTEKSSATAFQSSYWREDANHKTAVLFRSSFIKLHHIQPNAWSAVSFDTGYVLLSAISSIKGKLTSDAIKESLDGLKPMEVATSPTFSFTATRSPEKALAIYKFDNKGVTFEAMVP